MEYYILKLYQEEKKKCPDVEQGFDRFEPKVKRIVITCLVVMFAACAEMILTILLFPKLLWYFIGVIVCVVALFVLLGIDNKLDEFQSILQQGIEANSSNYYAYSRISENLKECNIYIANRKILIRPWIAPTMTFKAFVDAKQRILMSATLGKSGELERITGIEKIFRLPIVNDWDKKGLGRKFFTFPDLSLGIEEQGNIVMALQNLCKKSVFLVPNSKSADAIKKFYDDNLKDTKVFDAKDIEESKQSFVDTIYYYVEIPAAGDRHLPPIGVYDET